jgi:phage regulator Rha-like protein
MNTLVAPSNTVTMSSREVAELTGKQHHHVVRDIKHNLAELNLDASKFGCIYFDASNRKQTEYLLPPDLVMTLLTGYSVPLRHRGVKHMNEHERV